MKGQISAKNGNRSGKLSSHRTITGDSDDLKRILQRAVSKETAPEELRRAISREIRRTADGR
ncbi:MAG: hypothetical protein R2747_24260 [Pyrinomonadaceae bacterium]